MAWKYMTYFYKEKIKLKIVKVVIIPFKSKRFYVFLLKKYQLYSHNGASEHYM
jgi:hypothetical protein